MAVNFDILRNRSDKLFFEPYGNMDPSLTIKKAFKKLLDDSKILIKGDIFLKSPSLKSYEAKFKLKDLTFEQSFSPESALTHSFVYKPDFIKDWRVFGVASANFNHFGARFDNKLFSASLALNDSSHLCGNLIAKWKSLRFGLISEFSLQNKNLARYDLCFRHRSLNTEVMVSHFSPPQADGLGDIEISIIKKIKSMHNSNLGLLLELKNDANAYLAFSGNLKENRGKFYAKTDTNLNCNINFMFQFAKNVLLQVNYGFGVLSDAPYNVGFSIKIR